MARKKAHTPDEIVAKLRQAEGLVGQGGDGGRCSARDRGDGAEGNARRAISRPATAGGPSAEGWSSTRAGGWGSC